MHDTTGLQLASLGKRSNEISGRAIVARQKMGDTGSYAYINNLGRAQVYGGRVLIPRIYDTARVVRILGEDDSEDFVTVNEPFFDETTGEEVLYDLSAGRYDVVSSIGPGYATKREEAVDSMSGFIKAVPDAGPAMMDLVAKNSDWPGADVIAERLKKMVEDDNDIKAGSIVMTRMTSVMAAHTGPGIWGIAACPSFVSGL